MGYGSCTAVQLLRSLLLLLAAGLLPAVPRSRTPRPRRAAALLNSDADS